MPDGARRGALHYKREGGPQIFLTLFRKYHKDCLTDQSRVAVKFVRHLRVKCDCSLHDDNRRYAHCLFWP